MNHEVAFLHGGSSSQLATLDDLCAEGFIIREVYLPDLLAQLAAGGAHALQDVDRLFVADRLHPRLWEQAAGVCVDVARRGGILFLSGENSLEQVPGFSSRPTPTNFWWWTNGEDPGIHIQTIAPAEAPAGSAENARSADLAGAMDPYAACRLRAELSDRALRWHHHAVLDRMPAAAQVFVTHESPVPGGPSGALLALDSTVTAGTLVLTTMDPVYHHGARFMPGASELLHGVMRWMSTYSAPTDHVHAQTGEHALAAQAHA